ncbi:hypothetical protein LCGC14_3103020 [marine sediment metagenome]|uniref:Uncharacterized protein n=1 Tax=marine sediment metagenome TaxID=412755 RepID=A0A0F8W7K8_9ZZZZ
MRKQTELYLGCHIDGPPFAVTLEPFRRFLSSEVTPRFSGFTVTEGLGYWEGKQEMVRILTIIHNGKSKYLVSLVQIAQTYKARFSQGCVLVVETDVVGRFL